MENVRQDIFGIMLGRAFTVAFVSLGRRVA